MVKYDSGSQFTYTYQTSNAPTFPAATSSYRPNPQAGPLTATGLDQALPHETVNNLPSGTYYYRVVTTNVATGNTLYGACISFVITGKTCVAESSLAVDVNIPPNTATISGIESCPKCATFNNVVSFHMVLALLYLHVCLFDASFWFLLSCRGGGILFWYTSEYLLPLQSS